MNTIRKKANTITISNHFWDCSAGLPTAPVETQNYIIIQVAESYYKSHFCTENHLQCCDLEITYALTNGLTCATDDLAETVDKNECYLSFRNDCHELSSRRGCRFQTLAINFKDGPCRAIFEDICVKFQNNRKVTLPDLASELTAVISEFLYLSAAFSLPKLDSLITSILIKLIRLDTQNTDFNRVTAEEKLLAMVNYMDLHYLEIDSLEELAPQFGYTYGHICKIFKKQVGVTPKEYLLSKKMEHAAKLLTAGKSVGQVAEVLGYSNPYNFSRAFKKQYGVAPREWG